MTISTAAARRRLRHAAGVPSPSAIFLKGFLKHPAMVGSVVPSSRVMIDKMLAPVDWAATRLCVEYGPGVGAFSRPILDRLGPAARLISIDTNMDFIRYLRHELADPRFAAVHGSAADVRAIISDHGFEQADHVLSGLPFSTLPEGAGPAIAAATHDLLRPGGCFMVYQFASRVRDCLDPHFPRITRGFEWRNLPPCRLYWAWKD